MLQNSLQHHTRSTAAAAHSSSSQQELTAGAHISSSGNLQQKLRKVAAAADSSRIQSAGCGLPPRECAAAKEERGTGTTRGCEAAGKKAKVGASATRIRAKVWSAAIRCVWVNICIDQARTRKNKSARQDAYSSLWVLIVT